MSKALASLGTSSPSKFYPVYRELMVCGGVQARHNVRDGTIPRKSIRKDLEVPNLGIPTDGSRCAVRGRGNDEGGGAEVTAETGALNVRSPLSSPLSPSVVLID